MSKTAHHSSGQVSQRSEPSRSNPFATRWVRPGSLEYLHPAGQTLEGLLQRLYENGCRGQIVGPHGSGKSTLLHQLRGALQEGGRHVIHIEMHNGQRRLSERLSTLGARRGETIFLVDGFEQLRPWNRALLKRFCRRNECGLIVTSHQPIGLPDLAQTATSVELAQALVDRLQANHAAGVTSRQVQEAHQRHNGDLREMFFDLYDRFAEIP